MKTEEMTPAEAWVTAFADGWRTPADARALTEHFRPWLRPDFRFRQPPMREVATGIDAFERRLAGPLFALMPQPRGRVLGWAARGDVVFIELEVDGFVGRRAVRLRITDRFVLVDGQPAERETFFDPTPLVVAVLRTPRRWPAAVRVLLAEVRAGVAA